MKREFSANRPWSMVYGRLCLLFTSLIVVSSGVAQQVDKSYLLGRFDPETDHRFARIPVGLTAGFTKSAWLRKETLRAFTKMHGAAKKDGITLTIISATRNFENQKRIWENKWIGKTKVEGADVSLPGDSVERAKIIMRYSSMPGTSRHHWGTDMDLNYNDDNTYFETGEGLKVYQWLQAHAASFGFCQPYTSKKDTNRSGYEEEKWHWSYMPLASEFLKAYQTAVTEIDIDGFKGCTAAKPIKVINTYVSGITCK